MCHTGDNLQLATVPGDELELEETKYECCVCVCVNIVRENACAPENVCKSFYGCMLKRMRER
jgi:hypothetical protein